MNETNRPTVNIIAAMSENRVIGRDGDLPWRLPDEMKHFMRLTTGHTIVMGRKTFESIGCKPLPNRRNIIITSNPDYAAEGIETAPSVDAAIDLTSKPTPDHQPLTTDLFICGGQHVYRDALPLADRLYLTIVHAELDGDAHFPEFDKADWRLTDKVRHEADEKHSYAFTFKRYERCV